MNVLIVDDEKLARERLLRMISTLDDYTVVGEAASGEQAVNMALEFEPDIVLLDIRMPGMDGMGVLEAIAPTHGDLPVIVLTAHGGVETVVKAMRAGADDFVIKPVSPERLHVSIRNALKVTALTGEINRLQKKAKGRLTFDDIIAGAPSMAPVLKLGRRAAQSNIPVLIEGESGVGKELIASAIQGESDRAGNPFITVNCGAIPENLIESILFGHEKGAFTGALTARQGRFELAEGGTLFLDEIGDMPMNMQVKLLRVLQEKTFERVGSNKTITSDVRIVAATHQNLEQLVTEGKFRMDLFYRLNVFPIELPPLRDRIEDIPLLIKEFVNRMELNKQGSVKLDDSAMASLTKYYWPGNVRELSNLIERLAILFPQQDVKWSDLPEKFRPNQDWIAEQLEGDDEQIPSPHDSMQGAVLLPQAGIDLKNHLADIECSLMTQALEQTDWVVARAAKLLNLQRTTLVEKMRKFDISRPEDMTTF